MLALDPASRAPGILYLDLHARYSQGLGILHKHRRCATFL